MADNTKGFKIRGKLVEAKGPNVIGPRNASEGLTDKLDISIDGTLSSIIDVNIKELWVKDRKTYEVSYVDVTELNDKALKQKIKELG